VKREQLQREIRSIFAVPRSRRGSADVIETHLGEVAPKQARSRETLQRLLDAAEVLLEEGGLEAATVPAIADRAGVSVGVVYRRFPDKDALFRAVYERFFSRVREQNAVALANVEHMRLPLAALLAGMIRGMVEGYRRKRNILRALLHFARSHPDPNFRKSAAELNRATTEAITTLMLTNRERIGHRDPERAIEFVVLTIGSLLHNVILEEQNAHGLRAPENLEDELIRMMSSYLGV
jgi:AcrR family transcriptional regulator